MNIIINQLFLKLFNISEKSQTKAGFVCIHVHIRNVQKSLKSNINVFEEFSRKLFGFLITLPQKFRGNST